MNEDREDRERDAMAMHLWMADRAEEIGASYEIITYAWTGEFREDGVLVPAEESLGFSIIPTCFLDGAVGNFDKGFVAHQLFYSTQRDSYVVVETVWDEEPDPPAAFPIGKPHPDGTAPLRWLEEFVPRVFEAAEKDQFPMPAPMVAWASEEGVPCPLSCRTYPEDCFVPQWMTEEEAREQFPHLFREEGE